MNTTLQIRIDSKTKQRARKALEAMGLDMSSGVKLFLTQVGRTGEVPFYPMSAQYWPAEKKQQMKLEVEEALRSGKSFRTAAELHADILANP